MNQIHTKGCLTASQEKHFILLLDRLKPDGCFCLTPETREVDKLKRIISIAYVYGYTYVVTQAENSLYFSFVWEGKGLNGKANNNIKQLRVLAEKAAMYLNESLPYGFHVTQVDGEYWLVDEKLFSQVHELLPVQDSTPVNEVLTSF